MPDFGRSFLSHWWLDPGQTYLNHGTAGATPRVVLEAQQSWQREIERAPARALFRDLLHWHPADAAFDAVRGRPRSRLREVRDVVAAFVKACRSPAAAGRIINIGTGRTTSIAQAARLILSQLGLGADRMRISGAFRAGDIRHAVADIRRAAELLDWSPATSFEAGVASLVAWARAEARGKEGDGSR